MDGAGTLPLQPPGESVPWPLGAVSGPAAAAAGCLCLTAGAAAAARSAAEGLGSAAAWKPTSGPSHAAAVAG